MQRRFYNHWLKSWYYSDDGGLSWYEEKDHKSQQKGKQSTTSPRHSDTMPKQAGRSRRVQGKFPEVL